MDGDTFILCIWPLMSMRTGAPAVLESGNDLAQLCAKIPEHVDNQERLCVCRVGRWSLDPHDPSDATPHNIKTIMEVVAYDLNAMEGDE